ncbi:MAG: pseudaminic acid cytidylyltransferase [Muribaculaceae bacterium]|nr:pseudaminic acid cytidylyltransferase [Muribaculaceae bacterium]
MLCIIPARGGSKRIERKNIKDFCGVPIIAYSIQAALRSGCFSEVMVSTDDEEIAATALRFGAKVPFMRSAKTANDFATTADVIREVLDEYRNRGTEFKAFCCIYATAPFVDASRLQAGSEILKSGLAEAAFTCVAYSYPIQRCLVRNESGRIEMMFPEYANSRSQDLQPTYHDAGQFYFSTVGAFERTGSLWGPDTLPIILPETEVQDLDTLTDWELAEIKYTRLSLPKEINAGGFLLKSYTELPQDTLLKLLEGRNLPEIRSVMVNTAEISEESHFAYIDTLLTRGDKRYFAAYAPGGELIGSVTLDLLGEKRDSVERGIWLFPEAQGKGYATRMLGALYQELAKRGIHRIITGVKPANTASLALERALGAVKSGESEGLIHFSLDV